MAEVYVANHVRDELQQRSEELRDRVKSKLREAAENPDYHLKPLTDREEYSVRIGDYRAIVDWEKSENALYVIAFGHRRNVYDREL
jgi:mRNA interferase RelE/StbE